MIAVLFATLALASCSTSLNAHRARFAGPSALETGHWTKVRTAPPTYFPKGVPADHPTDFHYGSWVRPGDAQGSQFFIPKRGNGTNSEEDLIAEAWGTVSPAERARLEEEARKSDRGKTLRRIVGSPLFLMGPYGPYIWEAL